jgi:hypothetical protein
MAENIVKRELRVTKDRQGRYNLKAVDVQDGKPPVVAEHQPEGYSQKARDASDLPELYERALDAARDEMKRAFDKPIVEEP